MRFYLSFHLRTTIRKTHWKVTKQISTFYVNCVHHESKEPFHICFFFSFSFRLLKSWSKSRAMCPFAVTLLVTFNNKKKNKTSPVCHQKCIIMQCAINRKVSCMRRSETSTNLNPLFLNHGECFACNQSENPIQGNPIEANLQFLMSFSFKNFAIESEAQCEFFFY